ncbi:hypothetical protein BB560_001988 [Smittium megazygosporum]|uniref:Chorismate-utilising enzyme C-terminal domain-containing protein n=1 Tax=Smittium megazygosporum TaxID=133381 RepID=A0A2T9ZG34_9FUNG|nr:hypothetical protein BB560_001988 [Smittium megazygosporum]
MNIVENYKDLKFRDAKLSSGEASKAFNFLFQPSSQRPTLSEYSLLFRNFANGSSSFVSSAVPQIDNESALSILEDRLCIRDVLEEFSLSNVDCSQSTFEFSEITRCIYDCLYKNDSAPFLLDSSKENIDAPSMSIMGSLISPKNINVRYNTVSREAVLNTLEYDHKVGGFVSKNGFIENLNSSPGIERGKDGRNRHILERESFFDWAQRKLVSPVCEKTCYYSVSNTKSEENDALEKQLPPFRGGWVGYLGYEMHYESDILINPFNQSSLELNEARIPDVALSLATQSVVIFKNNFENAETNSQVMDGFRKSEFSIHSHIFNDKKTGEDWINNAKNKDHPEDRKNRRVQAIPKIPRDMYIDRIAEAQELIEMGESYELCLTNSFQIKLPELCFENDNNQRQFLETLYFDYLRIYNPAPMSAFFLYPGEMNQSTTTKNQIGLLNISDSGFSKESLVNFSDLNLEANSNIRFCILSCSPERFLQIKSNRNQNGLRWTAQMKPIKGTVKRLPHGSKVCNACCNILNNISINGNKGNSSNGYEKNHKHQELDTDDFVDTEYVKHFKPCKKCDCAICCYIINTKNEAASDNLRKDIKEYAENLMIVDLVRHDLSGMCINNLETKMNPSVPKVNNLETFETVFQLVSTVEAQLPILNRPEKNKYLWNKDTVKSFNEGTMMSSVHIPNLMQTFGNVFPPGSMTGAPKIRSVELLSKALEKNTKEGRGLYSGCIGYISAYNGQMDWSVVIRTLVSKNQPERNASSQADSSNSLGPKNQESTPIFNIDAGGAITILSEPEAEWDEVITKLSSVLSR